jgi:nucleoside-triphosphatase THEP1
MDKDILIDFIKSYSKLLKIMSDFIDELYKLELTDKEKLKKITDVLTDEEILISLIKEESPELSEIYKDLILNLQAVSLNKNILDLPSSEKKEYSEKLKEVSEKLVLISSKLEKINLEKK